MNARHMQHELSLPRDSFRLVRIGKADAKQRTDDFLSLRELVLRNEQAYPRIGKWFDAKVTQGIANGQRAGFVGLLNEHPVAAAVLKRGSDSKFCHLRIEPEARSLSLGDLFFTLMTLEVRHSAKQAHFTLPESVWEDRKSFFKSFSFSSAERSGRQYRLFDVELYSQTDFSQLMRASQEKLPQIFGQLSVGNHSLITGAVLALQPEPAQRILSGQKTVEVRTRFSERWQGRKISLYETRPVAGLVGEANVERVISGHPDRMWELFGHRMGCFRREYDAYVDARETVYALILSDVKPFPDPIPLEQLSFLLGVKLAPPQSYLSLENNDGWLSAVALAAALQGSLRVSRSTDKQSAKSVPTPQPQLIGL